MIGRTNAGGGGLSLTVKTHANKPASTQSGRENEIWVVSDTPCQYWAVKSTAPVASDFGEDEIPNGTIWIVTDGTSDLFDAIKSKKKCFSVSSHWCAQRIDGVWVYLDAYFFSGASWVQFAFTRFSIGYLYKDGIFDTRVEYSSGAANTDDFPVVRETDIALPVSHNNGRSGIQFGPVCLAGATKISFEYSGTADHTSSRINNRIFASRTKNDWNANNKVAMASAYAAGNRVKVSADVSGITDTGECWIIVDRKAVNASIDIAYTHYIHSVSLEV